MRSLSVSKIAPQLFFCLAALMLLPAAQAANPLLAPVYPGAVPDPTVTGHQLAYFLTRDPIEKVRAYYTAQVGKLTDGTSPNDDNALALKCRSDATRLCYAKILLPQGKMAGYLKDVTQAYDAGMVIESKRWTPLKTDIPVMAASEVHSEAEAQVAEMYRQLAAAQVQATAETQRMAREQGLPDIGKLNDMSDLFDGLKEAVLYRQHSEAELLAVYSKYQHLETSVYPYVRVERRAPVSYDRWLLAKNRKAYGRSSFAAENPQLKQKMQQLAQAGKFEELQQLSERVAVPQTKDHWNDWLGFLKDLDAHAYQTRIIIHVDPKSWGRKL